MQAFIGFLGGIVTRILAFFGIKLGSDVFFRFATIGTIIAMTVVLYNAIQFLLSGIIYSIDSPLFNMYFWALYPDNASTCLAVILQIQILTFVFRYKVDLYLQLIKSSSL